MRSTTRRFLAAILLTAAAGFALSQEAGTPPAPTAPDVAAPVAELPQLPVVSSVPPVPNPNAPAVDPAVTIDPNVLAIAPATTNTSRVTKSSTKPVARPSLEATGSFERATADRSNPRNASANAAPPKSEAPAPAAVKSVIPETPAESRSRSSMILGEWMLAGALMVALFSITQLLRRRSTRQRPPLVDLKALAPELKSIPVTTRL